MSQGKKPQGSIVLLTTGGTIAGWAAQTDAQQHYQAGALPGQALLAGLLPDLASLPVVVDDFARINSKDADGRFWWQLYQRLQQHLADDSVAAIVITHGTDTLEETAFFLSEVLPQPQFEALPKAIIMVAAMRPASHPQTDGPQNLADALRLAQADDCAQRGVLLTCGGLVYAASQLQKWHGSYTQPFVQRQTVQDALAVGAAAAWGQIRGGAVQWQGSAACFSGHFWQKSAQNLPEQLSKLQDTASSPRVEIITSHAGSSGLLVQALLAQRAAHPLYGLVVAGTGCGTIHQALKQALHSAQQQGVQVVRASQCLGTVTVPPDDSFICWPQLSPRQARVRLILQGLAA
jgi:L-asparaginase